MAAINTAFPTPFTITDVRCEPSEVHTGVWSVTVCYRVRLKWWAHWWFLLLLLRRAVRAYRRLLRLQFKVLLRKAMTP